MKSPCLALLTLAGCLFLSAQGSGSLPLRMLGNHEGLESSAINVIHQDPSGILWVGTEIGLQRYDGRFLHPVQAPLPDGMVLSLASEGSRLWVGTLKGLLILESGRPLPPPRGLPAEPLAVTRLQVAPDGQLWFLVGGVPWRGTAAAVAPVGTWAEGTTARGLFVEPGTGTALACAPTRVLRLEDGQWQPADTPGLARGEVIQAVATDGEGRTWLRTTLGAWTRPPAGAWRFRPLPAASGYLYVQGMGRHADGSLWIAAGSGLYRVQADRWESVRSPLFGPMNVALLDREGTLWLGAGSLFQVMGRGRWRYWNQSDGLPSSFGWQVLPDEHGRAWAATDGGLALGTPTGWRTVVPGQFVHLRVTADGTIWATGLEASSIYRIPPGSDRPLQVPRPAIFPVGMRLESLATQGRDLWMVEGDHLWRGRPSARGVDWERQPRPPVGHLRYVTEDRQGGLFLSGDQGFLAREGEAWVPVEGLAAEPVLCLARSPDGTLALGYGDRTQIPILRREGGRWRLQATLQASQSEGQRVVYALTFDRSGRLWVGTNRGLLRMRLDRPSEPECFEDGEGLTGSDISSQSLRMDREGRLWVCTATSICRFDAEAFDAEAEASPRRLPPPILQTVMKGTELLPIAPSWDLAVGDRLRVGFTIPTYLHPESLRFQALVDDGRAVTTLDLDRPILDLPNFGAHSYQVTLLGLVPGQGKGPGTTFRVVVHPPFWATRWAFALYLIAALSLAGAVHLQRQAQLRQRAEALEALVAQRTEELLLASQAKSAFLANMSHELRTPLTAILLYSEILKQEATEGGRERELRDASRIHAAGQHLMGLINDVLDLSRIEAGRIDLEWQDVSLPAFLADLEATLRPLVEQKQNRFTVTLSPGLDSLRTDPLRLRQILSNLLSNAGKFTEGGEVELTAGKEGTEAVFAVRDTGIGMSEAQLEKVFDAFVQADTSTPRLFGGTGLGLALVRQLSQLLGGTVSLVSRPAQGSTFTVRIPLEPPTEA